MKSNITTLGVKRVYINLFGRLLSSTDMDLTITSVSTAGTSLVAMIVLKGNSSNIFVCGSVSRSGQGVAIGTLG